MDATSTLQVQLVATATAAGANAQPVNVADPVAVAERAMDAERASWGAPDATVTQRMASAGRLLEIRRNLMRDLPPPGGVAVRPGPRRAHACAARRMGRAHESLRRSVAGAGAAVADPVNAVG